MPDHVYTVTVTADTADQADTVIAMRLGHDEEVPADDGGPFPYRITAHGPADPAVDPVDLTDPGQAVLAAYRSARDDLLARHVGPLAVAGNLTFDQAHALLQQVGPTPRG